MSRLREQFLSGFKYLLAFFMILSGIGTILSPPDTTTNLGFIYASKTWLVVLGLIITISGLILLYGKIRKSRYWTGAGLYIIYNCFLFAAILNAIAYGGDWTTWVGNAICAIIVGALWVRWKFKTKYSKDNYFKRP